MNNTNSTNQLASLVPLPHAVFAEVKSTSPAKRRYATLNLTPLKTHRGRRGVDPAYIGHLVCDGHVVSMANAVDLGVAAYVMGIGTVEVRLPALLGHASKLYAHQTKMPSDLMALYSSANQNERQRQTEAAEGLFAVRFATGLRVCTQSAKEPAELVDLYAAERLPKALHAVPLDQRRNTVLRPGR